MRELKASARRRGFLALALLLQVEQGAFFRFPTFSFFLLLFGCVHILLVGRQLGREKYPRVHGCRVGNPFWFSHPVFSSFSIFARGQNVPWLFSAWGSKH